MAKGADHANNYMKTGDALSPAEKEAKRKVDLAAQEAQHQADLIATKNAAELAAAAIVPPPARTEATDIKRDCLGQYAKTKNCRNVQFHVNEIYHTEVPPIIDAVSGKETPWCTFADPVDAGHWEHLGGRQFAFIPNVDNGARVTFFEVKQGEKTFTGVTCK